MIDIEIYNIDISQNLDFIKPISKTPLSKIIIHDNNIKNHKWKIGDILYSTTDGILTYNNDKSNKAIAICVIGSDFIPSDPAARFMSLDDLSLDHVYNLNWGDVTKEIDTLDCKYCIPNVLAISAIINTEHYFNVCNGYRTFLASDMFNHNEIPYSNVALGNNGENGLAPNPYLKVDITDNSFETYNKLYEICDLNNEHVENVLADFNGDYNTKELVKLCTNIPEKFPAYVNQHNWYPAAYVCNNFNTIGTNKGDWYLPSIAELGIMYAKITEINKVLKELRNAFEVQTDGVYWSSTQGNEWGAYFLKMSLGGINIEYKTFAYAVRAFMKIQ